VEGWFPGHPKPGALLTSHMPDHGTGPEELAEVLARCEGARPPGDITAELVHAEPAASATVGIWRFSAGDWSVILKVLGHRSGGSALWQSGAPEDHWYYWRREANAYSSGLLSALAGGLRAPSCIGVFDRPDGTVGLWLEDLGADQSAAGWDLDRYRTAATALGRAQGAGSGEAEAMTVPWLVRGWLDAFVERRGEFCKVLDDPTWGHPLVREWLPADTKEAAVAIWEERRRLLDLVSAVPLVLCHNDLHPGNLFSDGADTVLIDWSFVSIGRAGIDPATLVFDAVLDFYVDPDGFGAFRSAVVDGYVQGFSETAPDTDPGTLRLSIRAASAVKHFWIPLALVDTLARGRETLNRRPLMEAFPIWAKVVPEILTDIELLLGAAS